MNGLDSHLCTVDLALRGSQDGEWRPTSCLISVSKACRGCALVLEAIRAYSPGFPVGDEDTRFKVANVGALRVDLECSKPEQHLSLSFGVYFAVGIK